MNVGNHSYETIDTIYANLYAAYMRHNRDAMILYCGKCQELGIPQFHEKANAEVEKMYHMAGITTFPLETTLQGLPNDVLSKYALGCMNVLFDVKMQSLTYDNQQAYQLLSNHPSFQSSDILYAEGDSLLTVENFLKVIKYAIAVASIIDPESKAYSYANASVLALQGIDDALNNKSKVELTNHTLHVATDFLSTSVKESLSDTNAKRGVAVSALLVNLAIDFLVK